MRVLIRSLPPEVSVTLFRAKSFLKLE